MLQRLNRRRRGSYGIDAPYAPAFMAVMTVVCLALAIISGKVWQFLPVLFIAAMTAWYLHTTLRGRFLVWAELLDNLGLRGDERILDMGCGRGAVLLMAAQHLTTGRAVGVDLWRRADQSGNSAEATRRNVLVLDPSGFAKTGGASCGVARQWCGRLGKVENCQVGVFLTYATAKGYAPLDRRLYLPREWAEDARRRQETYVPEEVTFQESWRIGLDLLDRSSPDVPFGWVAADDEFGRASAFRAALRQRGLRYVLDVPCNTSIRDLGETPPPGRRLPPWRRVDEWAKAQPPSRWRRLEVGDGSKGPRAVRALETWVQTRDDKGRVGPVERLVVIRTVAEESQVWYTLSNACDVGLAGVVQAHGRRHGAEELFRAGKGEVGLAHYEVRSWVGWHHHMTLSLLALWFLALEKDRLGGKIPALTVPQMHEVFARLLRPEPPGPARIAEEVSRVLRRNEEARIYHWYAKTGRFPPRRGQPDG